MKEKIIKQLNQIKFIALKNLVQFSIDLCKRIIKKIKKIREKLELILIDLRIK